MAAARKTVRGLRRTAAWLACLYLLANLAGCVMANRMMFFPPVPPYGDDLPGLVRLDGGKPGEDAVAGLWSPVPGARRVVLFSHGNAEDLRHYGGFLRRLNGLGYSALSYDYPGYGRSGGAPTERGAYRAAEAAWRYLAENQGFAPTNILIAGFSIGTGPACRLARDHPDAAGLVLFAPFTSAIRVVTRIRLLPYDPFPNLANVKRTSCRIAVVHGTADDVIPHSHGEAVAASAGPRSTFVSVPFVRHNDLFDALSDGDLRTILEAVCPDAASVE